MRVLALITARGGSKRIPGKNVRLLGGKPLIQWSIDVAIGITEICDILVSTDDPAIGSLCTEAGAFVPWLRPAELATDTAKSADVALHAIDWYEEFYGKVDGVLLLQPTSPFRSQETIRRGITLFSENHYSTVVGVSTALSHPMWCFKIDGNKLKPFVESEGLHTRSQDLSPAYVANGAFYLLTPERLRETKSFYSVDTIPMVIEQPEECMDIDTEWDWKIAEAILTAGAITGVLSC